jgi:dTDP-4-dehydrorhamnose reductase
MILLFGGSGQLGRELSAHAQQCSVPLSALTHPEVDIADSAAVSRAIESIRPSLVVNAAAYTKVDLAEREIELAYRSNSVGPSILAQACSHYRTPLVHISTDHVFDGRQSTPYRENDLIGPINVYGASKAAGEQAIRDHLTEHVILRTSWLYSAYGHNILKTIVKLARERDHLKFVSDQRGSPTSTHDLAEAILRVTQQLSAGRQVWGTYHFAGEGATTWYEFARQAVNVQAALTGRQPKIEPIPSSAFPTLARRPLNSVLDCTLFARTFAMCAQPWQTQVKRTVHELLVEGAPA